MLNLSILTPKRMLLIIGLLVVVGVGLRMYLSMQEQAAPLPTPGIESLHNPLPQTEVEYSGPSLQLPESLPVYQVTQYNLEEQAERLAQSLDLSRDERSSKPVWRSENRYTTLSVLEGKDLIQYSVFFQRQNLSQGISSAAAVQSARAFLEDLGLGYVSIIEDSIQFLGDSPEAQPANSPDEAYFVVLSGEVRADDYPLYVENQAQGDVRVWVRADGEVIKAELPALPRLQKTSRTVSLENVQEKLDVIAEGEGTVVQLGNLFVVQPLELNRLQQLEFSQIEPHFRVDTTNGLAYPYYSFSGMAVFDSGEEQEIEVVLPAYEEK